MRCSHEGSTHYACECTLARLRRFEDGLREIAGHPEAPRLISDLAIRALFEPDKE